MSQRSGCCEAEERGTSLEDAARLFAALGDPTRLAILQQLGNQNEVCVCDLQACCERAQPTISYHLKILRKAGLVTWEKRGQWVYYRLNRECTDTLRALLP